MSQTRRDIASGLSSDDKFLFPLGPFSMNESFLIAKRMDLPLFQPKKKIHKQWMTLYKKMITDQGTTLYKKMITNQGIRNPVVTYLYSNCLDLVFPINQFLQIMDRDLEILTLENTIRN